MCGAHDAIYELTAYRDPNLIPIKAFYEPCPKVSPLVLVENYWFGKRYQGEFAKMENYC